MQTFTLYFVLILLLSFLVALVMSLIYEYNFVYDLINKNNKDIVHHLSIKQRRKQFILNNYVKFLAITMSIVAIVLQTLLIFQ